MPSMFQRTRRPLASRPAATPPWPSRTPPPRTGATPHTCEEQAQDFSSVAGWFDQPGQGEGVDRVGVRAPFRPLRESQG